jgi:hypothetical protein
VTSLRSAAALALLLASSARATPALEHRAAPSLIDGGCGLLVPGSEDAPVAACLRCHERSGSGHPVGLDYARESGARRASAMPLRSASEAIRRGAFLPGGELRCTTCHDGRSPWRFRLALPPGAAVRHAVVAGNPETYGPRAARGAPAPGEAVGTKPLCLLCHALD